MNQLEERMAKLLDEPWLGRDLGAVRRRAERLRHRRRQRAGVGLALLALVLIGPVVASGLVRAGGDGTVDVAAGDPGSERAEIDVVVFVDPQVTDGDRVELRRSIAQDPAVLHAWWVDQGGAFAEFECWFAHDQELVDGVVPDVLPGSFDITLAAGVDAAAFEDRMRAQPAVMEVVPFDVDTARSGTTIVTVRDRSEACARVSRPGEPVR